MDDQPRQPRVDQDEDHTAWTDDQERAPRREVVYAVPVDHPIRLLRRRAGLEQAA